MVNASNTSNDLSKSCVATNDYVALYSRNLSLKKVNSLDEFVELHFVKELI